MTLHRLLVGSEDFNRCITQGIAPEGQSLRGINAPSAIDLLELNDHSDENIWMYRRLRLSQPELPRLRLATDRAAQPTDIRMECSADTCLCGLFRGRRERGRALHLKLCKAGDRRGFAAAFKFYCLHVRRAR